MGIINQLDYQVANLIAAGEVVDRPSSACKELLENSIDAGATIVTVEIKNGGISLIRVSDNGKGMSREDVAIAIKRHATSKIKTAEDLDSIATLGFRGEALAAIASVSHLRILTKRHEDSIGTLLECAPGCEPVLSEVGISDGTTVIAENLFANVPARRKFLKKDYTEAMAVTAAIEKVALSNPSIAVRLIIDGQTRFATAGDGILKNTIYSLLGRDFANKLIPVSREADGISIEGYIGTPENVRANRNYQNFFINGRYVKSKCAQAALEQAFTSYCSSDRFPTCVLNIKIDPRFVDVNVHPAKLEVKFANEKAIFEALYYAVRGSLESKIPRPKLTFDGKTASDITYEMMKALNAFVPIEDKQNRQIEDKNPYLNRKNVKHGQLSIEEQLNESFENEHTSAENNPKGLTSSFALPFSPQQSESSKPSLEATSLTSEIISQSDMPSENENKSLDLDTIVESASEGEELFSENKEDNITTDNGSNTDLPPVIASIKGQQLKKDQPNSSIPNQIPDGLEYGKNPTPPPRRTKPPEYRIIGEAYYSYIFVEVGDKILIIDKHAAHERIIFEDLKQNLKTRMVVSQILIVPVEVTMTPVELASIEDYRDDIKALGFDFYKKDDNTISVNAIPSQIDINATADILVTIADRIANGTGNARISRDIIFEKALYQASCKAAIKVGHDENPAHIKWICDKLLMLDDIKFCPHGRPVAFELSKHNIEHQFKRI